MLEELLGICAAYPATSFENIIKFIRFAQIARPTLELATIEPTVPPLLLPTNIAAILAQAISVDLETIGSYWSILKDTIWTISAALGGVSPSKAEISAYNMHALSLGTCELNCYHVRPPLMYFSAYRHLYPPVRICMHCHGPLKEPVPHKAALFTLREGVLPISVTSLYCRGILMLSITALCPNPLL